MNLADRSLALVDYALRRRFAFKTMFPQFDSDSFAGWLEKRNMGKELVQLIVSRMSDLNKAISEDELLGENYMIGHSYFCPTESDLSHLNFDWYKSVIETEILPLLAEYWFDNKSKQDEAKGKLLAN